MFFQRLVTPACAFAVIVGMTLSGTVSADQPSVETIKVSEHIYMLTGQGGNVGVFSGTQGTIMIDDQYAPMTGSLMNAIVALGGSAPKFVLNTHFHEDHTGGNENLGKTGAIIVAHQNVRESMSSETFIKAFNMRTPAKPAVALPVVTFAESMSLHLNGDTLAIQHVPLAHTNGDSFVYFQKANVLHTGDLFFNGFWLFIDVDHGGTLAGMVVAADAMLALINTDTAIIPGHGPLARKQDLQAYRDVLARALQRLQKLKKAGKTLQQVIAAKPLAEDEAIWGDGFLTTKQWLGIVYSGIRVD